MDTCVSSTPRHQTQLADSQNQIVRRDEATLAIRQELPDAYRLGTRLARAVTENSITCRAAARQAINEVLRIGFEFTDGSIDLETELLEIPPEIDWTVDKRPDWLPGESIRAKCEIGLAMARAGADSTSEVIISTSMTGQMQASFTLPDRRPALPKSSRVADTALFFARTWRQISWN